MLKKLGVEIVFGDFGDGVVVDVFVCGIDSVVYVGVGISGFVCDF